MITEGKETSLLRGRRFTVCAYVCVCENTKAEQAGEWGWKLLVSWLYSTIKILCAAHSAIIIPVVVLHTICCKISINTRRVAKKSSNKAGISHRPPYFREKVLVGEMNSRSRKLFIMSRDQSF